MLTFQASRVSLERRSISPRLSRSATIAHSLHVIHATLLDDPLQLHPGH
jgi:hypothetical protein